MKTRKVVINQTWGGFNLSRAAVRRYAQLAGLTLYPAVTDWEPIRPLSKREKARLKGRKPDDLFRIVIRPTTWRGAKSDSTFYFLNPLKHTIPYDVDIPETFNVISIPRDDPKLIQVVEELGEKCATLYSKLKVVKIPADVVWEIEDYDGMEQIREKSRVWG